MPEDIKMRLGPWGGIIASLMFIISFIGSVTGILSAFDVALKWIMIVSAVFVVGFGIYLLRMLKNIPHYKEVKKENEELKKTIKEINSTGSQEQLKNLQTNLQKKEKELEGEIEKRELLEQLVCDGKKYLDNQATIEFDIKSKKYKLSFTKTYVIISDAIKWYEGQFYSNMKLDDAVESQAYYRDHQVGWDELKFAAELKYQNEGEEKYSKTKQVKILRVAEGNNYKKFHIQYRTNDDDKLNIKQGAKIVLTYSYEVPVALWGSYLNRYISYWGETASVKVKCLDKTKIRREYFKVFQTDNHTGDKYICDDVEGVEDCKHNEAEMTFKLPQKKSSQYSIWWDAESIFGIQNINTNMTADQSQLTHY